MARARNSRGSEFLKAYHPDEVYLLKPARARGAPGIIEGSSASGDPLLIRVWPRSGKIEDKDLVEIWRNELRLLHRLGGAPGAEEHIAHLLDAGEDPKGFSWSVMALYCLSGRQPVNYGDLGEILDGLDGGPVEILRQACSHDPKQRPAFAHLLLADLEAWMEAAVREAPTSRLSCHVQFTDGCQYSLAQAFGPEIKQPLNALLEDFATFARVRAVADDPERVRIIGETWQLHAVRHPSRQGVLLVEKSIRIGSAAAERQREPTAAIDLALSLGVPVSADRAVAALDEVWALAASAEMQRADKRASERDRIYRVWSAYLRARSDYETGRGSALRYSDAHVSSPNVTLSLAGPAPPDLLGQDRMINVAGVSIALEVTAVVAEQVTLRVTYGDAGRIPQQGVLEVNTRRALSAIEKQRRALDDLAYGRSIQPELADIIMEGTAVRSSDDGCHKRGGARRGGGSGSSRQRRCAPRCRLRKSRAASASYA